jgi:hypothetical protein
MLGRWAQLPARLVVELRNGLMLAWAGATPAPAPAPASTSSPSPTPGPQPCGGGQVSIDVADGTNAPGLAGLQHVTNIVAAFVLVGCVLAFLVGILIATSGRIADQRASVAGRLMVLGSLGGAFGVGIVAALVNFAYRTGQTSC